MDGYHKNIALCKRNHIPTFNLDVTSTHLICRIVQTSQITNSLPWEQKKKRRKGRQGTKDQVLIAKMIVKDCTSRLTSIDYNKAYNMVPYSWM